MHLQRTLQIISAHTVVVCFKVALQSPKYFVDKWAEPKWRSHALLFSYFTFSVLGHIFLIKKTIPTTGLLIIWSIKHNKWIYKEWNFKKYLR